MAKVRSWRSFIRDATLASVECDGDTIRITPGQSDSQRIDVFTPLTERERELLSPSEVELGAATLAAVAAERFDDERP